MIEITMTNEEKVRIKAAPTTPSGKVAPIDGRVTAEVTLGDCTVELDAADPLAFWVVSGDNPGDSTVVVSADADLGAGVVLLQDAVMAHVSGAMAVNFGLVAEAPVPK